MGIALHTARMILTKAELARKFKGKNEISSMWGDSTPNP